MNGWVDIDGRIGEWMATGRAGRWAGRQSTDAYICVFVYKLCININLLKITERHKLDDISSSCSTSGARKTKGQRKSSINKQLHG